MKGRASTAMMVACLLTAAGACALAGCGSSTEGASPASARAVEQREHAEETAEAKREEDAEAVKTKELLSEVEAEKGEENVAAAEAKAKRIEATAEARAKKREHTAEAKAEKREEAAKQQEQAVDSEIKKEREALSKEKREILAKGQSANGSDEVTTTATAPSATGTPQVGGR